MARAALAAQLKALPTGEAAAVIERMPPAQAVAALLALNPAMAQSILGEMDRGSRRLIVATAPAETSAQWKRNARYARGTIGQLMEPALTTARPAMNVDEAIEELRPLVGLAFVTYVYVTSAEGRLLGVVTMRDLLFGERVARMDEVMLREPFTLSPGMTIAEAMRLTVNRHYPQYPVCDAEGRLVGVVRGAALFELEAFEITAQPGAMVGVEKEERIATPIRQSFRFRNPWLLANLVTAFAAGGVVAMFQGTVDRLVILATFLPVLAGQSGNTGCQALAVTVRGITLGDVKRGGGMALVTKEMLLGIANGAVTGVLCGLAMYLLALSQSSPHAAALAFVVCLAMIGSCAVSGISGALVPLALKRLGADPATASSIVVTTATDVASMGLLLGLATVAIR
ncbi:MAG TPA: magnesium transporter [Usitatibacter sp.]|nr:magnesium transporter [Usitatibacter sp.]